ncbi:hypothetical protein BGZ95_005728 [Linnemannia exigua]|uniref:F-box domain-containing protein n=1 Tax=Linnemannia exigua TaxID=604196 RepID=A0AAD4DGH4_9FUNG|nr:hypothetical protein BGZ95_005728 [Linnemannia exigua]
MSESRSPFDITEIVERILSHADDLSLRRTVPFVCRQWFLMIKEKPLRQLAWDNRWGTKLEPVLASLPGAGRFLFCHQGGGKKAADKVWKQLLLAMETYSKRYYEGFHQQRDYFGRPTSTNCRLFYTPLREVDLRIDFIEGDQLCDISFPSSLTSLKLDIRNTTDKTLYLWPILARCRLLEVVHVGQVGQLRIRGCSDHGPRKPLALRSLVLRGVAFEQWSLEVLLSDTPRLQELKLIGVQSRSRSVSDRFESMGMDSERLYTIIQKLGLPIDSFHFSVTDCAARDGELRRKLYLYPRCPTEWSFWVPELEPYFMKELALNTNNVTTLDVFWDQTNRYHSSSFLACNLFTSTLQQLHQYLCSSPQLQSLKVVSAAILLDAMDLHRRSGYIDPDCGVMFTRLAELEKTVVRPGIWACRGLQHLSIEVHSHRLFELTSPVHSRIIFGYISRVCPNLEVFEIKVPDICLVEPGKTKHTPVLFGRLDGGLCLLSRLRKLRAMKVVVQDHWENSSGSRRDALNWIHSSGHDAKSRAKRQGVVAGWERGIEMEKQTELDRASRVAAGAEEEMYWIPSVAGTLESGLTKLLENLGLLSDVKNMVDEMDVDGYCCLPVLKLVSFGSEVAQAPEDALDLLDPKWFWSR